MDNKKFYSVLAKMAPLFEQTHKMYSVGQKKTTLEIDESDGAYTDGERIHIGLSLNGPLGMLLQKTEKDTFNDEEIEQAIDIVNYLIGHECGHVRYTDDEQYMWGIKSAYLALISYGYEYTEGKKVSFVEENDATNWIKSLNESAGYVINHQGELKALMDYIAKGALEDALQLVTTLTGNTDIPTLIRGNLIDIRMALMSKKKKEALVITELILRKNKFYDTRSFVNLTAWLENSLEDGRMEGAMAAKYEIFKNQRRQYRIIFRDHEGGYPSVKELEDPKKLVSEIMSAILSLATTQMYNKGFSMFYHSVPAADKPAANKYISTIESLHKDIYDAYIGTETIACSKANVNICKKLAPIIWEAFGSDKKETIPEDIKKLLEKLLKAAIEESVNNLNAGTKKAPANEMRDSAFPFSDLTVTLDDDTYDKLMDKMKNEGENNGEGNGINIKREHPLPEPENKPENPSENSNASNNSTEISESSATDNSTKSSDDNMSNSISNNTASEPNASFQGASEQIDDSDNANNSGPSGSSSNEQSTPTDMASEGNSASSTDSIKNEKDSFDSIGNESQEQQAQGQQGCSSDGEDNCSMAEQSSQESFGNMGGSEEQKSNSTGNSSIGHESMSKEDKKKTEKDTEEQLLKEIEAAKKATQENLKDQVELAKAAAEAEYNRRSRIKEQPSTTEPLTKEEVKKICSANFIEISRKFPVDKKLRSDLQSRGNVARRNMEKILIPKQDRDINHMTSGGLDIKRLSSLGMGKIDVFKKTQKGRNFSGCVYILKDNSGSMSGDKNRYACESMAVLEESYKGLLPLKIAAFSDLSAVTHQVIKDWDEVLRDNCSWNFLQYCRPSGGNSDGYDIQIATYELLKRPERNKLLIVLSDGMPSDDTPGYTKGAIEDARNKGVKVCGIYFENGDIEKSRTADQFKQMYEKDYVCCDAKDIDKNLLKIMRRFCR